MLKLAKFLCFSFEFNVLTAPGLPTGRIICHYVTQCDLFNTFGLGASFERYNDEAWHEDSFKIIFRKLAGDQFYMNSCPETVTWGTVYTG